MGWFGYSLIALVCFTFFNLLNRVVAVKSEEPRAGAFAFNVWGALVAIVLFLFTSHQKINLQPLFNPFTALLVIASIIMYSGYERLQFTVKKHIDASTTTILFRLSPVFTFILSILFLRESLSIQKIIGVILILSGNLLLVIKGKVLNFNKYFWFGMLCTLFLGIAWTIDKAASSRLNSDLYTLLLWVGPVLFIFLPWISLKSIKNEFILGSYKSVIMAVLNVVGFYFQIVALSKGEASRVIPIISANSVLIVILAIFLLNERSHVGKKLIAVGLATVGVILLSNVF